MNFVAITNQISFTLWIAVYILCVLCFVVKRSKFVVALGCGVLTVVTIVITLFCGATLVEIGIELLILVLICIIARGCKK